MSRVKRRRKAPPADQKDVQLLKDLCEALSEHDIETRIENGRFRGGACIVEGEKRLLILNKRHPVERQIAMLLSEFKKLLPDPEKLPFTEDLKNRLASFG
ncbi:MAG TPA: hypothetical protein PKV71_05015 [Calditrichia bacterium]|nr:hypothetical protein [Calditrichota bacterium]HQU73825.1 hypothetical protein [Calditrichia bacterium]HQV31212.1 hypothetical protein [Calditrichia bacterium]